MFSLPASNDVYKRIDGRWCKPCPSCKEEQDYLRRNYAINSYLSNKECKKCSNKKIKNNHRLFFNSIRLSWFNKIKNSAITRGIFWDVLVEQIWELYKKQEGVCFLSGMPIGWSEVGVKHTASLDRIDSSGDYVIENVQLVHKDINMMKQSFDQEYFILMCSTISDNIKQKEKTNKNETRSL